MKPPKKEPASTKPDFVDATQKIDFSDIPETDEAFWANAEIRIPQNKKGVYLRIDPDTLAWFKKQGKGYQTRINAVLRQFIEAQKPKT